MTERITTIMLLISCVAGVGCLQESGDDVLGQRFVAGAAYSGGCPVLAPDNETIVFGAPILKGKGDICRIDIDGHNWRQLTSTEYYEGDPDVSPDNKTIVFVSEKFEKAHIFTMSMDGKNVNRLTTGNYAEHSPRFSTNGKTVAFTRRLSSDHDDAWSEDIFIVNVDGTNEQQLTDNKLADYPVAFSEDDSCLYFLSSNSSLKYNLLKIEIESGKIEQVSSIETKGSACDYSEKTNLFVYSADKVTAFDYDLFIANLVSQKSKQLTTFKGYIGGVRFGIGDPSKIVFLSQNSHSEFSSGRGEIMLIDLDNDGEITKVSSNLQK